VWVGGGGVVGGGGGRGGGALEGGRVAYDWVLDLSQREILSSARL